MKRYIFSVILLVIMMMAVNHTSMAQSRPMSDQAKGAVVGGAAGVVAGGLIGHDAKSAVIGGAIGAGGGYIVGDAIRRKKLKEHQAYLRAHRAHHYAHTTTTAHTTTSAAPKSVTTTTVTKTVNYR